MTRRKNIPVAHETLPQDPYSLEAGLYNVSCTELTERFPVDCEKLTLIHADPPWDYENYSDKKNGAASSHYRGLPVDQIAGHLIRTYAIAAPHSYLAVWATFPKLMQWSSVHTRLPPKKGERDPQMKLGKWSYITGGAWGKIGTLGPGYHFRGDSEILLLYKKGSPRARTHQSNLWLEKRRGHSWKSIKALRALVEMGTSKGGFLLDLYAGDSGDLARICRALDRAYFGSEIDPKRFRTASLRIGQAELPGMELALPKGSLARKDPKTELDGYTQVALPFDVEGV